MEAAGGKSGGGRSMPTNWAGSWFQGRERPVSGIGMEVAELAGKRLTRRMPWCTDENYLKLSKRSIASGGQRGAAPLETLSGGVAVVDMRMRCLFLGLSLGGVGSEAKEPRVFHL